MIADIGYYLIWIALLVSLIAGVSSVYGAATQKSNWVEIGRNSVLAVFPLTLTICLLLIYLIWTNDFSVKFVTNVTSTDTPKYLKITSLWGSQAGSLMLWNMLLSLFMAATVWQKWKSHKELMPFVILVACVTQVFFLLLSAHYENPFIRLDSVPVEGKGLNPLLRHPGMIIHPPTLYLGFVGLAIPYAFAMAALITGKLDDGWIRTTRRWTLIAWLFLSVGLILGGRWAYDVLGWGGYWAWDPVENASFMPWLAATGFLHSVMIQEKLGIFRIWNMILIILTFILMISGTFIVRSGIIESVHSFAQSDIGKPFLIFTVGMLAFSIILLVIRWDQLATPNSLRSMTGREAAFLLNNFLFLGILGVTALGTYFPIISDMFGQKITVGPPYYEKLNGPLFGMVLLLMGVAPLTMWHRTMIAKVKKAVIYPAVIATLVSIGIFAIGGRNILSVLGYWAATFSAILTFLEFHKGVKARMKRGESAITAFGRLLARNRRRYGGYFIHMGVFVMAIGIISMEFYQTETQVRLASGEQEQIDRFTVQFQEANLVSGEDDITNTIGDVLVYVDDKVVDVLHPRIEFYERTRQTSTIPDRHGTLLEDLYILIVQWEGVEENAVTLKIYHNPMVSWVWAGGIIFAAGTLVASWPDRKEKVAIASRVSNAFAPSGD